jgi:hypothetical protein
MEGSYKTLNVNNLLFRGTPFIDPITRKIHPRWLPVVPVASASAARFAYGKYSRKDIVVGHIHLEVSEDGVLIQLVKDQQVFAEKRNASVVVGERHRLIDGVWYTLTNSENSILEIDTTVNTQWDPNPKLTPKIRKYILVKR